MTPWTACLSFSITQSLLELMPIELVMACNHLILCRPLLPLPSIFPSIRVFSNESVLRIRGPECWSFSFSVSPSGEHSRLIFFWWLRWSRICLQCRRPRFNPWVRKIPWRGNGSPLQLFLPGEPHGQRSLAGYSPWGCKRDWTERLTLSLVHVQPSLWSSSNIHT